MEHYRRKSPIFPRRNLDSDATTPAASLNDNVITIYNDKLKEDSDSVNDEKAQEDRYTPKEAGLVGRQLANFLEKTPRNTGGFVNKAKQCNRTVIRAAVIDVLVHTAFPTVDPADERGRPKNRAGWFHDACNKYADGAGIPAYISVWVKTDLSWQEIEQNSTQLRHSTDATWLSLMRLTWYATSCAGRLKSRRLIRRCRRMREFASNLRIGTIPDGSLTRWPRPSSFGGETWMDEYEAEELAQEMLRDAGPLGVTRPRLFQIKAYLSSL